MLLQDKLKSYTVILASASPRRRELLKAAGITYRLAEKFECDEEYPASLPAEEVAPYLSLLKSHSYPTPLSYGQLLITADTTVILGREVLGKPSNEEEAKAMLRKLSGREHSVITGVTLRMDNRAQTFSARSVVRFTDLTEDQINYYVENYHPLDKAGAYGIQEWIGRTAIESIEGSFYNVMGLPVAALYKHLASFV